MTLVALLALTTHAWATDPKVYASGDVELSSLQVGDILMPGVNLTKGNNSVAAYLDYNRFSKNEVIQTTRWKISSNPFSIGLNGLINAELAGSGPYNCMPITEDGKAGNAWVVTSISGSDIRIGGTIYPEPTPFAITWSAATPNTASIEAMPAGNVTVSVDYFAQAELAESGAPTAINDVPATTDEPIVTPGTVANIGTSEVKQGTLMYFVSQSTGETAPEAPDYDADGWSEDVPTANGLAQGKAYVWYYIKGAEPANIADRSDDNTRSDSDIMPLGTTGFVTLDAEPTFDVSLNTTDLAEGEPALWKAKSTNVAEVNLGTNDLKGVKKSETVTVTYTGTKKVIGVKVEKSDGSTRLDESTVGMIVCTNGKAYPVNMKDNLPSGVTAVGIVAYKNGKNGLVMALTDEATNMNWGTATGNNGAKAHTPAVEGYSWKVPTIGEWQYNIFTGAGVGNLAGLSTYMTAAGGTGLQNGCYWTSTPKNNDFYARCIKIENGSINFSPGGNTELKSNGYYVRAVFAF